MPQVSIYIDQETYLLNYDQLFGTIDDDSFSVPRNVSEFSHIEDLLLYDWTVPSF